jgi:hypothetical protein
MTKALAQAMTVEGVSGEKRSRVARCSFKSGKSAHATASCLITGNHHDGRPPKHHAV